MTFMAVLLRHVGAYGLTTVRRSVSSTGCMPFPARESVGRAGAQPGRLVVCYAFTNSAASWISTPSEIVSERSAYSTILRSWVTMMPAFPRLFTSLASIWTT